MRKGVVMVFVTVISHSINNYSMHKAHDPDHSFSVNVEGSSSKTFLDYTPRKIAFGNYI